MTGYERKVFRNYSEETNVLDQLYKRIDEYDGDIEQMSYQFSEGCPVIMVDTNGDADFISLEDALFSLHDMKYESQPFGRAGYILLYDVSSKIVIDEDSYLPGDYLIMKSCNGLSGIEPDEINDVLEELDKNIVRIMDCERDEFIEAYTL